MRNLIVLVPAALVAIAAPAQVMPTAPKAPKLTVTTSHCRIVWSAQNAYYVKISPGSVSERPISGSVFLPSATYTVVAVGERNRTTCITVVVR